MKTRTILFPGLVALAALALPASAAVINKTVDRKFPTGTFCPLESRAQAGADLSFVAAGPRARITFTVDNFKGQCNSNSVPCLSDADCPALDSCARSCTTSFTSCSSDADCPGERCGPWNQVAFDNVTVVLKSVFEAHLLSPSPFYQDCYFTTIPPGQTEEGLEHAPSYDFNATGTAETDLELFDSAAALDGWSGRIAFDARSAPRVPAASVFEDLDETGGSLGVGRVSDGAIPVSATRVVQGLTPGQTYVVFGWWSIALADRLALTINTNACIDADGDGFVACGGCDPDPGQTCGDCDDARPHCTTSCADGDGDGYCAGRDCDDTVASCNSNCATDADLDGTPDCRDGCLDFDRDGWGSPGVPDTCLGADCEEFNALCNANCTDNDGDAACIPQDCADSNPQRYPGAPEINDCADQECPGDYGYGVKDETSGNSGFRTAGDKTLYSWPAQPGASSYQVARSNSRDFSTGCAGTTTSGTSWLDATVPASGAVQYYLNRPLAPCLGSWGQNSALVERTVCASEICTNAIDDDGDSLIDCADSDCAAHPACQPKVFTFVDGVGDDIATTAFAAFLQPLTVTANDYFYFGIVEPDWSRTVAWCAQNAAFYRSSYLLYAPTQGSVPSGTWSRWRRAPITGNAWAGPFNTSLANDFGNNAFGEYSWCSEQFPNEPQNCLFPDRVNDCEAYDLATGACAASAGTHSWTVTIRIAPTRLAACGF